MTRSPAFGIAPRPVPASLPWSVSVKSSQLVDALRNARSGQTITVFGGGEVEIPAYLTLSNLRNVKITAEDPVTLYDGQLTLSECSGIILDNLRIYPHAKRTPLEIAAYIQATSGLDGRALVINNCHAVTVRNCTFAACTDDMAGVSGESDDISYDRCMFVTPLGVYGQGLLGWTSSTTIRHVPAWLRITGCVFTSWYRCPKLEGGQFLVANCIMAGAHYRPIELHAPKGAFFENWFYPMKGCDCRMIIIGGNDSHGLHLRGNRLFGQRATWNQLVGLPTLSPSDPRNVTTRTGLDADSTEIDPTEPSFDAILGSAGTRGVRDAIENAAIAYARLMAQ